MTDERELLRRTAEIAADFLDSLEERPVFPRDSMEDIAEALGGPLPDSPTDPLEVVELLAREVDRGVVATAGSRYYGYVTGSALPATIGADWLTTIWDQCAGLGALGPSAMVVEEIAGDWLKGIFDLPDDASFAITTGCQMAHVTALAAARHALLRNAGWNVELDGLFGAPPIRIIATESRHSTLDRALRFQPNDATVWMLQGVYLSRINRINEAIENFKHAVTLNPDSAEIHYNLALIYLKANRTDDALKEAQIAYAANYPLMGLKKKLKTLGVWAEP